ncbi:hypothetical protein HK102_000738 [Quaeritorhiza haematococci]|nr:hypothetical protein HK102_000738 [Quaeritorhiza haematococci]
MSKEVVAPATVYSTVEKGAARRERENIKDDIHDYVVWEGTKAGLTWGAGATLASLALQQKVGPQKLVNLYSGIRPAYKIFLVAVTGLGAFFTRADKAAVEADRIFANKFAINADVVQKEDMEALAEYERPFEWTQQGIKNLLIRRRYEFMGLLWTGTMAGSLLYNFSRKDIAMSQKLINSRMIAQSAALAAFVGFAGVAQIEEPKKIKDAHFEKIINSPASQ